MLEAVRTFVQRKKDGYRVTECARKTITDFLVSKIKIEEHPDLLKDIAAHFPTEYAHAMKVMENRVGSRKQIKYKFKNRKATRK